MKSQQINAASVSSNDAPMVTSTGGVNASRAGTGTFSNRVTYNPDEQFQGIAAFGQRQGSFVAEQTHFQGFNAHTPTNYSPQVYDMSALPKIGLNTTSFRQYAPKSWYLNSASQQLDAFNQEEFHLNDSAYQANFMLSKPSYVQDVVHILPADEADYYRRFANYSQQHSGDADKQNFPSDAPANTGFHFDPAKLAIGAADLKIGYSGAKNFYSILEGEETAGAFGESLIGAGETAAGWIGSEGLVAGAAEAIGGAAVVGGVAASIGLAAGVGLAAYGLYEGAVALGAPTLGDDLTYIGNGAKDVLSKFSSFIP